LPRYDYMCDENGRTVEVVHSIATTISNWGELCELASIEPGDTPMTAPIRKVITTPPMANTPAGNAHLKNLGFTKLEKRYDGTYENVTRTGTEKRFLDPKDPSSLPHIHKKVSD